MIEASFISNCYLLLTALLMTFGCVSISNTIPWSKNATLVGLPFAFAISLAPIILGMLMIMSLKLFPNHANSQLYCLYLCIGLLFSFAIYLSKDRLADLCPGKFPKIEWSRWHLLILIYAIVLIISCYYTPLTLNDPLEYATIGRVLFNAKNLDVYPVIQPGADGFYAPSTHPPMYAALIYLSYLLQGSSQFPGLLRGISPWFLLVTTYLIYTLGKLFDKQVGVFAALLLVSTPLLFLGAKSATIDALPVLGMAMILASILGVQDRSLKAAVFQGAVLGIAMWTHSEAILFFPLTIAMLFVYLYGLALKAILKYLITFSMVAVSISAAPYMNNYHLFGSLISDAPAVFLLPKLDWSHYFALSRGIDSTAAKIQYGIFKGWFSPEAFSFIFWLMSFSFLFYKKETLVSSTNTQFNQSWPAPSHMLKIMFMFLFCYYAGVFLSIFLNIDQMIRNERYLLITLPIITLLAGWALMKIIAKPIFNKKITLNALFAVFTLQLCIFVIYDVGSISALAKVVKNKQMLSFEDKPEFYLAKQLSQNTNSNDKVFSLYPAALYYGSNKMITFLDPKLIPFYNESSPEKGFNLLNNLGITYVQVPDYYNPPIFNSTLQNILANPKYSSLTYTANGHQIYQLNPKNNFNRSMEPVVDFSPANFPWYQTSEILLGGRKSLVRINSQETLLGSNGDSKGIKMASLFQRDRAKLIYTGNAHNCISIQPGSEYLITFKFKGNAFVRLFLMQITKDGQPIKSSFSEHSAKVKIGEMTLVDNNSEKIFLRRYQFSPNAKCVNFFVEHLGESQIRLSHAELRKIT